MYICMCVCIHTHALAHTHTQTHIWGSLVAVLTPAYRQFEIQGQVINLLVVGF